MGGDAGEEEEEDEGEDGDTGRRLEPVGKDRRARDGDEYIREPKCESGDNAHFEVTGHLERPEEVDRQNDHDAFGDDI